MATACSYLSYRFYEFSVFIYIFLSCPSTQGFTFIPVPTDNSCQSLRQNTALDIKFVNKHRKINGVNFGVIGNFSPAWNVTHEKTEENFSSSTAQASHLIYQIVDTIHFIAYSHKRYRMIGSYMGRLKKFVNITVTLEGINHFIGYCSI